MKPFFIALIGAFTAISAHASSNPVFEQSARMPLKQAVAGVEKSLKQHKFKVVGQIPISRKLAKHAKAWGADYNQNHLQGIYGIVFCNGKTANAVSNADPAMLSLCPLHLTITEKNGLATVHFVRPSVIAADSAAEPVFEKVERKVTAAIGGGLK